jgi:hypothetical protein
MVVAADSQADVAGAEREPDGGLAGVYRHPGDDQPPASCAGPFGAAADCGPPRAAWTRVQVPVRVEGGIWRRLRQAGTGWFRAPAVPGQNSSGNFSPRVEPNRPRARK